MRAVQGDNGAAQDFVERTRDNIQPADEFDFGGGRNRNDDRFSDFGGSRNRNSDKLNNRLDFEDSLIDYIEDRDDDQ